MKRILKNNCPKALTQWFTTQPTTDKGKLNCRYSDLPSDIRATIKQHLLAEQGHICCYTGIRINEGRSHIEHLKPQSQYFENHEDIDYHNLLAAYPGSNAAQCAYGAHSKADWYDNEQFISPLSPQCETAFQFNLNGEIIVHSAHHPATQTTIDQLNLTHQSLTEMRQQAIQTLLFESELSLTQAKDLLEKIYDRNTKGQFRPFCFVLKQACEEYIRRKKQKQTRVRAIQAQPRKLS
jgi:uncharacterized protein (TIGR02646 family)